MKLIGLVLSIFLTAGGVFAPFNPPREAAFQGAALAQDEVEGVIVFVELDGNIYLYDAVTGQRVQLTSDSNRNTYKSPRFSPDGKSIAFMGTDYNRSNTRFNLNVMDLASGQTRTLVQNVNGFDWNPDGRSIAFGYDLDENCQDANQDTALGIWQVDINSNSVTEIVPAQSFTPKDQPDFSYDGKWMIYWMYPCFSSGSIPMLYNLRSEQTFEIGFDPHWSGTSNQVVYSTRDYSDDVGEVRIFNADTGEDSFFYKDSRLTPWNPVWSPDGQWIVFHLSTPQDFFFSPDEPMEGKIMLISMQSGEVREIFSGAFYAMNTIWSPDSSQFFYTKGSSGSFSPDWNLYTVSTGNSVSYAEFGNGGIDWVASAQYKGQSAQVAQPTGQSSGSGSQPVAGSQDSNNRGGFSTLGILIIVFCVIALVIFLAVRKKQ